mgnify:FL=1|jgi:hypothetical protein|tara:strand:+ start:15792 stop:16013 length:222 start_codon:yes stop_codon:yes gene_type:complete
MIRKCIICEQIIPEGRIKIIPHTRTCVEHSTTAAYEVRSINTGTSADNAEQSIDIIKDPELAKRFDEYKNKPL